MEKHQILQDLFADAEGRRFTIVFRDGDNHDFIIVSVSHAMLDGTAWGLPLTPGGEVAATEPGIQFDLQDVESIHDFDTKRLLFGPE